MAADWSQLPKELLHLISECLDNSIYLIRFRSVCSAWRSSLSPIIPNHQQIPFTLPPLSDLNASYTSMYTSIVYNCLRASTFSKLTLFLITPPPHQHTQTQTPWLVKMGQDLHGRTRLWHPLSGDQHFPFFALDTKVMRVLDLYHLRVFYLGNDFVLHHCPESQRHLTKEKVVSSTCPQQEEDFVLLTTGNLALFRSGDERWTIIPDTPVPPYDDICFFNGRTCAVDETGRTVALSRDSALELVAEPVFGGDKKLLVESQGELLLVDKYWAKDFDLCFPGDGDDDDLLRWTNAVNFDVFRLDEKEKRWVKTTSLGDRVLFLGDDCAFSASVSDLCVERGNCVVFTNFAGECKINVFPLDIGRISPLSDHPDYSRLFWPPPDWVSLHLESTYVTSIPDFAGKLCGMNEESFCPSHT